jgi:hypothetical protein
MATSVTDAIKTVTRTVDAISTPMTAAAVICRAAIK